MKHNDDRSVGWAIFWWSFVLLLVFIFENLEEVTAKRLVDLGARSGNIFFVDPWWKSISSFFLHWNSFHFASNLVALGLLFWVLRVHWPVLWSHLSFGLGGVLAHLVSMRLHPKMVSVGASGGTYALLGSLSVFLLMALVRNPSLLRKKEGWLLVASLVLNGYSLSLHRLGEMSLDYTNHRAGFAFGVALAVVFLVSLRGPLQNRTLTS